MKKLLAAWLLGGCLSFSGAVLAEEAEATEEPEVVVEEVDVFVVGKAGKKFHTAECKFVKEAEKKAEKTGKDTDMEKMSEAEAKEKKLMPCAICHKAEKKDGAKKMEKKGTEKKAGKKDMDNEGAEEK